MRDAKTTYTNNLENRNNIEKKAIDIKLEARNKSVKGILQDSVPKISGPHKPNLVPFYKLFRYATCGEVCSILLGILFGILAGLCTPVCHILYGEFNTLLIDRTMQIGTSSQTFLLQLFGGGKLLTNATAEENKQALLDDAVAFGVLYAANVSIQFLILLCSIDLLNVVALKQIHKIRRKFFESVLRQDMSWYDTNTGTNFASSITEDLDKMKNGIGEKIGIFIFLLSSFIFSIIISLIYGWKLTLVLVSCAPIIIISSAIRAKVQSNITAQELKTYGAAGAVAEEVLGNIKTVVAFGGENIETERYANLLESVTTVGTRKGAYTGITSGIMWFVVCASYALGFWYGVQLILNDRDKIDKEYNPAVLVIIFLSILGGAQNMGFTLHHLESFAVAQGAAAKIFTVIDRKPIIDSLSKNGLKPNEMKGNIEFTDIHFEYPARPTVKVLNGLNFSIKSGERVAFVGGSGCGKSTLIQLVQRMYDPSAGSVTIDGIDISTLNVHWLRQHIGVVGQEPVLFATSISNNIALGCSGASTSEIENAAIAANCHGFIMKLPNGYDTIIGERGSQLSGGQKQRIAIARALIRKPTILLLDEATSALDLHSETKVQQALDRASYKCTTLIVSHRLSTIRNVDRIIFIKDGKVAELGTHEELMELGKNYHGLVQADILVADKNCVPHLKREEIAISPSNEVTNLNNGTSTEMFVEKEKDDKILIDGQKVSLWRIMKLHSKEWRYLLCGTLAAIVVGSSFPIFAVIFGNTYATLSIHNKLEVIHKTELSAIYFAGLGVMLGIGAFLQCYLFNIAGTRLTTRIRVMCFGSMLKQEIGWYDDANNSVGALCARLSGDAAGIQGATGFLVGAIMQIISSFAIAIGISLFLTWKLTLVALLAVPISLLGVYLEDRIMRKSGLEEKQAMNRVVHIAVEAISNVRTVASLNQEHYFIDKYMTELASVNKALQVKRRLRGTVISFGQVTPFLGYALTLWYGGNLVANKEQEFRDVIIVSQILNYAARMMGQVFAYAPNFNAAWISADRIFQLFDRTPKIVSAPELPEEIAWKADGHIKYSKIDFSYPTRPKIQILQELNLTVQAGTTVALVGGSGCGKSTCIQLLQRLYDPDAGALTVDSKNISKDMSIRTLRSQMGIVSQEPVLFNRTIAENIAYGDNSRHVTEEEIIKAAITSNIHNFISALPLGYETRLGVRGTQLSGGQKQRVAIARALVRDPRILLLDEATSALDNQSEKVVQAALDAACEGRTCIIIAHRLATIRNADVICVLDGGNVTESGTHEELIASGGTYSKLYYVNKG